MITMQSSEKTAKLKSARRLIWLENYNRFQMGLSLIAKEREYLLNHLSSPGSWVYSKSTLMLANGRLYGLLSKQALRRYIKNLEKKRRVFLAIMRLIVQVG